MPTVEKNKTKIDYKELNNVEKIEQILNKMRLLLKNKT